MFNSRNHDGKSLANLPYEVCNLIILHLPIRERIQCIQVSKTWRSIFLSSPSMWNDISECQNISSNLARYDINGQDIQTVNVVDDSPNGAAFLWRLQCTNIRSLTMAYHGPGQKALVYLTGNALTNLCIVLIAQITAEAFFSMVFDSCSNLTRLQIDTSVIGKGTGFRVINDGMYQLRVDKPIVMSSKATEAMSRLQELSICAPTIRVITYTVLKQFLPYFTGLKHLYLAGIKNDDAWFQGTQVDEQHGFLNWIDDTFSSLQTIWLVPGPRGIFGNKMKIPHLKKTDIVYGEHGRKSLAYDATTIHANTVDLFLKKHAPIIDAFHTNVDYSSETSCDAMHRFINHDLVITAHHLRSLAIENLNSGISIDGVYITFPEFDLEPILSHFPLLERLVISGITLKNAITETTTAGSTEPGNSKRQDWYRSLKTVVFRRCKGLNKSLLMACINNRFQQNMNHVCFMGLDDMLDDALDAVSRNVQSLKQLIFGQKRLDSNTIKRTANAWSNKRLYFLCIYLQTFEGLSRDAIDAVGYAQQKLKNTIVEEAEYTDI